MQDARALADAGFRAGIIQNTHDLPSTAKAPLEMIAFFAAIGWAIRREVNLRLGANVLKNDAESALAVAATVGAECVWLKLSVGAVRGAESLLEPATTSIRTWRG